MAATLLLAGASDLAAQLPGRTQPPPPVLRQRSRLFSPLDLGMLEAPDREAWGKPDLIMDLLGIADGSVVADLGAGGGWFTVRLARRVGPRGIVYAEDIQRQMVEVIKRRVQREGLHNVVTLLGTASNPNLPPGLDAVLIVDAYHEIEDPVALLANVARSLKPQGRIGVVDFKPGGGGPGPRPEERVTPDTVRRDAELAGLVVSPTEDVPPFQYALVLTRGVSTSGDR